MPNYNKLILVGYLVRDPEQKTIRGTELVTCSIAVNNRRKSTDDNVMYLDLVLFGTPGSRTPATTFSEYLHKGSAVLVEGRLQLGEWVDKEDGTHRSKHEMLVENWHFIDSKHQPSQSQEPEVPLVEELADEDPIEIPF